jgi:hypothetical protein
VEIYNQFKYKINNMFTKKQPEKVSFDGKISEMATVRSRQDIAHLRSALNAAESTINPSRYLLLNIYENIITDAHLTSVIQNRKKKVISKSFQLVNKNGKEDLPIY